MVALLSCVGAACAAPIDAPAARDDETPEEGLPIGGGAPPPPGPSDPCAVPWKFDERGRPIAVPAACTDAWIAPGDPPDDTPRPWQREGLDRDGEHDGVARRPGAPVE